MRTIKEMLADENHHIWAWIIVLCGATFFLFVAAAVVGWI